MKHGEFLFYVSPKYIFSSYKITQPIWARVKYDYSDITKQPTVKNIEFSFSVIHAINISENMKNEIIEAAKNNAESTFKKGIALEDAYFTRP